MLKTILIDNESLVVSKTHIVLNDKKFDAYELTWRKPFSLSEKISNLDDFLKREEMPFNDNGRKYIFTDLIIGSDYELWGVLEKHGWRQLQDHEGYWKRNKGEKI